MNDAVNDNPLRDPVRDSTAKKHSVLGSAKIISGCILLSRILGFVRDMLCSGFFGWIWDAFALAFTIPNLFRRLFGEGALSSAFIPTFSDYLQHKERSETQNFINIIATALAVLLSLIALLVIGVSFIIPYLFKSAQYPEYVPLFAKLLRIMIPYLPIICLVALLSAILNSLKHFTMPALASVVLNISWIAAFIIAPLVSADRQQQVVIIAWAIIIGGLLELVMQIPVLLKYKIGYKPKLDLKHPGVKEILRLMGPATFGLAVFQINLLVDYMIALYFVRTEGAISALYFGNRIMQFPLALIGISMAIAVFPYLAECVSRNNICEMKQELSRSLRLTMFIALPASIGLIVLAQPLVDLSFNVLPKLLFKVKGFTEQPVHRTTMVLAFYALGIWAYCGLQIITRAFYAFKDMKTPVKIGIRVVFANFILNIIFVQFLQEGGIALGTAITSIVNFFILFWMIQKNIGKWERSDLARSFVINGIITILMGVVCYLSLFFFPYKLQDATKEALLWIGLMRLFIPLFVGMGFYMLVASIFKRPELKELWYGLGMRKSSANTPK